MPRRLLLAVAALSVAAGLAAPPAPASGRMLLGIYDDAQVLGHPDTSFPLLKQLRVQVVRVTLHWGGPLGVAVKRPANATDPADPAYNWAMYDRAVLDARDHGIKVVFTILDTPLWASGAVNRVPPKISDLRNFAYAAARRYSGTYAVDDADPKTEDVLLPAVRHWLAWNEPNNPVFLFPQFKRVRVGKKSRWIAQSPRDYARICSAIYTGVHLTTLAGQRVACGVTAPRGNNIAGKARGSIGPIPFLRGLKKAGLRRFDAYAHHPYYGRPTETPTSKPKVNRGKRGRVAPPVLLGNIGDLTKELTRLYGAKRLWITEYGYQTRPPDRLFGVTYSKQATYLRQAYRIARRHPRVDMMLWFLLKDEQALGGWQSGLISIGNTRKPAFSVFRSLRG
ncbi:MAG: hypothetical protein ABR583_12015 [Gaiellaceae bacterium]